MAAKKGAFVSFAVVQAGMDRNYKPMEKFLDMLSVGLFGFADKRSELFLCGLRQLPVSCKNALNGGRG